MPLGIDGVNEASQLVRIIPYLMWIMRTDTKGVKVAKMSRNMINDSTFHSGLDFTNGSGSFTGTGTNVPTGQGLGISGGDWLGAGVALVNAGINAYSQYKTNEANQEISQRNYDAVMQTNAMNKELSERTWARDDSQLQRARRDAELAGFSPMAALSNNLTNSSPLQMQAPQYTHTNIAPQVDLSNVGNIFSQAALKKQQTEQLAIANQYSRETLNLQKLKTATELQKLLSDLDSQKLSNAEKASVLLASGFKKSDVENLLKNNRLYDVPTNTAAQDQTNLIKAQTAAANASSSLSNAQTTTQSKLDLLYEAQKSLVDAQKSMSEADKKYWFDEKFDMNIPTLKQLNNNDWTIIWQKVNGNRKHIFNLLDESIKSMEAHKIMNTLNMADWQKFGELLKVF